jgi:broad specificity phosphatase PhoE
VRHGAKAPWSGDPPLSPVGIHQAWATATYLRAVPLAAVYASPLRRARETAVSIAAAHALSVVEDARLRERANWGDLPGQSFMDFVAMWERCTRDPTYAPPVGDSARQAGARMDAFLRETTGMRLAASVAVVTHGGVLADFLVQAFALDELNRWHPDFLAAQSDVIAECSITRLAFHGATYTLASLAETRHLAI